MPNDDESKKDEQESAGSAKDQAAEQKLPVYLFPENSVYDLAPIVVPDDIRLSPDTNEEDEPESSSESSSEPSSELSASVPPESETPATSVEAEEQSTNDVGGIDSADATERSTPSELSDLTPAQIPETSSTTGLPPRGSRLKAKIQVQKVRATQEQAKIAQDSILKNRIDNSKAAQSRIEQARAELSAEEVEEVEEGTANSQEQVQQPTEQDAEPSVQQGEVRKVGDAKETLALQQQETGNGSDTGNFFPENSVYELDPVVVVAEDQKLMPTRRPTYDPNRVSQKLSPIKFDKFKSQKNTPPARKAESSPETEKSDQSSPGQTEPPAEMAASSSGSGDAEPQTLSIVQSGPDESDAISVGLNIAAPFTTETQARFPESSFADSQPRAEPAESSSNSQIEAVETSGLNADRENNSAGSWEEPTGWEEVNSRQDRWSEQTGWEDAAGKSSWEESGWAEQSGEQKSHAAGRAFELSDDSKNQFAPPNETALVGVEGTDDVSVSKSADSGNEHSPTFHPNTVGNLFSDGDDDFPEESASISDAEQIEKTFATASGATANEGETADWLKKESSGGNAPAETHGAITGEQDIAEHGRIGNEPEISEHDNSEIQETSEKSGHQNDIFESGRITAEHNTSGFDETDQPVPGFTTGKHSIPTPLYSQDAGAEAYITGEQRIDPMAFVTGEQPEQSDAPQILPWGNPGLEGGEEEMPVGASLSEAILETETEFQTSGETSLSESILSEVETGQSNFEPPDAEPFDVNRIGIATADIDQIFIGAGSLQLTEGNQDEDREKSDDYEYDEEDVLQDFRSTDSIYELAPFVLPANSERLTDDEQKQPAPKTQPTVQQIVRHAETPERPAIPTYSTDPLVGTVLAHSYEVLDVIGQGGMAIVYRAKQIATGRLVAIKTLRSPNPQDVLRFSQEIKTHSQLDHKNIVGYIDSFSARDQLFLVMERVRGISLQEIIRALGKLEEPENIVDILSQILDALDYAHAGGLIHRDLKTGNIILIKEIDNDMVVKILDFGIAKVQGDMQRLTHVGQALGSPIYMSPEQCSGKLLSTRSDLYSLGVLLYESVTGTPPYSKGTLINVMAAHCNENIKPKPLAEMEVQLPKTKMLDQILQKALQTHPDKRWQSAQEFKTALHFWLKCVQMDLPNEDLPVELQRCPVSELDVDKLLGIASGPASSEPVPFQWATESTDAIDEHSDSWGENKENEAWAKEQQQHIPGWGESQSESVPGQSSDSQTAADLQNPSRASSGTQPWGGSERHRQSQTGDAWRGSAAAAAAAQAASTSSGTHQKTTQEETSDTWSADQKKMEERRPVRDLLASPSDPQTNFEVQTSAELNALGTGLPKLSFDEKEEIRAMTSPGSLQPALNEPDSISTTDEETQPAPLDLRRRQQQATPPPPTSNWVSIAMIVVVSVVLTFCLSAWYFVSNPTDVQAKFQALQNIFSKPSTSDNQKQPESSKSRLAPGSQDSNQTSSPWEDSSTDIGLESNETGEGSGIAKPRERKPEEGVKPTDPGEFRTAEPEEGVDF